MDTDYWDEDVELEPDESHEEVKESTEEELDVDEDMEDAPESPSPTPAGTLMPSLLFSQVPTDRSGDDDDVDNGESSPLPLMKSLNLPPTADSTTVNTDRPRPPVLGVNSGSKISKPMPRSNSPSKRVLTHVADLELTSRRG